MSRGTQQSIPVDTWRYFVEVGLWPKRAKFDPASWLENFKPDEVALALRLLQGFTYFSGELVQQMFRSAFMNVSQIVVSQKGNYLSAKSEWSRFLANARIVRVTGETPSDADSGYIFSRLARDVLGIPEGQIQGPYQALRDILQNPDGNVVFVDDFVGSGNQFIETWERPQPLGSSQNSFATIASATRGRIGFYYCPVICTDMGRQAIKAACPEVEVVPAHLIDSRHSVLSSDSVIWREDMRHEGPEFVRNTSARAGIADLQGKVGCWTGFQGLGLALAFEHNWPDATIPLFYWNQNDWKPLLKKGAV